jgi:hypothetical protein
MWPFSSAKPAAGSAAAPLAVSLILQLPGGSRKMVSVTSSAELLAGASRLLGAEAAVLFDGTQLSAASPLPSSLSTLHVEPQKAGPVSSSSSAAAAAPAPQPPAPEALSEECAICLEHFSAAYPPAPAGACRHGFHEPCLRTWRTQSAFCPLCRGPMFGAAPPPPQQLQQQPQQQPQTVVVIRQGVAPSPAYGYGGMPPPSADEVLQLLLRTRAQLQGSPEWRLLCAAVREAGPLLSMAGGAILRGVAMSSPGITGRVAGALLSAGGVGSVLSAMAGAGMGAGMAVNCPRCRAAQGVPFGATRFACTHCSQVIQV